MENVVQIFEHEKFGKVRFIVIDSEPWFVGKDVALSLAYSNPQKAIRDHVDDDDKRTERIVHPLGGAQNTLLINESGMYALIFGSKLPKAKEFKHWVTYEVLPAIRKTGSYTLNKSVETAPVPAKKVRRPLSPLACVYVILLSNGLIKIGHTGDIARRISEIERQTNSTAKDIYHSMFISREVACRIEKVCQKKFSSFRVKGEFFNMDFAEVCNVIDSFVKVEVESGERVLKITITMKELTENQTFEKALLIRVANIFVGRIYE